MKSNNKVHLTIKYGEWQVDTSTNPETGEQLAKAEIIMEDLPDKRGKFRVKKVKLPMVFIPIGTQSMIISKSALTEPIKTNGMSIIEANVRAIAQSCGIQYHSHYIN